MFGWLGNAIRTLVGAGAAASASSVQAALNVIGSIFTTTYQYWHTVSGHVAGGWQQLTRTLLNLRNALSEFMFAQYQFDHWVAKQEIPWLANWISWLGGKIQHDIAALKGLLQRQIVAGDNAQHAYTRSVLVWVILHVLTFLYNILKTVLSWVNGIGATMWHYFTHLADFAELLFMHLVASLEKHAWDVAPLLGRFLLALIVRNVVRFATLIEDIVDAVL